MGLQTFFSNFALLSEVPNFNDRFRTLALELAFSGDLSGGNRQMWVEKKVDEIASLIQTGFACNRIHQVENGYIHLRTHNINIQGKLNFDLTIRIDPRQVDERKAHLKQGDLIFNNTNSQELVGKTCLVNRDYDFAYSNHLTLIRLKDGYAPNYVVRYFNLLWRRGFFANLCNRWIGQAGINTNILRNLMIPFPQLEEQERIVAEIDELMRLCDELEAQQQTKRESRVRLNTVILAPLNKAAALTPDEFEQATTRLADNFDTLYDSIDTVSKLRSTILQLGVQGKLVPQDSNDEPGDVLLRRIQVDKEQLVKQVGAKRAPPTTPLSEPMFDLPLGWTSARFGDVFLDIEAGWSPQCKRNPATDNEWGVLKVSSVSWDYFRCDENKALPEDIEPRLDLEVAAGDFLISRANTSELVAKSVVVKHTPPKLLISDKVLRVHFPEHADKEFYNYFNNSQLGRDYYAKTASGTSSSMKNISQVGISMLPVPVPPLAEQKRIVAKVSQLMSLCDELEAKLRQAEADGEKLMNAAVKHVLDSVRDVSKTSEEVFA